MPRHSRNEVKAGALMVVAFVLLCAGIVIIADFGTLLRPKKTYHFTFDMVEGLKASDDVMYAGIKCGRVTGIEFREYPECDNNVGVTRTRVLVTVEADATVPIRTRDLPKVTRGLTGNVFMDIIPYTGEREKDPLGSLVVRTTPDNALMGYHYPSFGEVSDKAKDVLGKMGGVLDSARDVVQTVRGDLDKVGRALDDVQKAAGHVEKFTGDVQGMVERNEQKVDPILDGARRITENVDEGTKELRPEVLATIKEVRETIAEARTKIDAMLTKLDAAAADVRVATAHGRDVAAELRGLQETQGPVGNILENTRQITQEAREIVVASRPSVDTTIEEMRQAAARLNLAMEDIRRNPWKLLTRNIEADAYTQNIYDAAMSFAEGARALSMTSANLENLLARKDVDPRLVQESADRVNKLVDEMTKLERLLYEAMRRR